MGTPGWLRAQSVRATQLERRIEEALREIGILFIAFGPLDFTVAKRGGATMVFFVFAGLALVGVSWSLEWRYANEHR